MHISEMQEKIEKKSFILKIMALQKCCVKFTMFRWEYLSSVVNVLANSVKISDHTKADFLQLNLPQIHEKIG